MSADGRWIATGSWDTSIILWDAQRACVSQEWFAHDGVVRSLAFSPDGQFLASSGDHHQVHIWDITQGAHVAAVLGDCAIDVSSCAWSSDGALIAVLHWDGLVQLWDAHTFQRLYILDELEGFQMGFYSKVVFLLNGRWLAVLSPDRLGIWDISHSTPRLLEASQRGVRSYHDGSDSRSPRIVVDHQNSSICIWDVETGETVVLQRTPRGGFQDVIFSPDGRLVLSSSHDTTLNIWDTYTGAIVTHLEGRECWVSAICFSPCGEYIVSAFGDNTWKIWRVRGMSCLATLSEHGSPVINIVFTPDGKMLWFVAQDGTVFSRRLIDLVQDELLQ